MGAPVVLNAPLLEKLEIHYVEEFEGDVPPADANTAGAGRASARARATELREQITPEGAWLMGYEWLIDIDVLESKALHWPWAEVSRHLPTVEDIARGYNGRRLFVLYNPATERRIGTTHSFFATISSSPPDNHHAPHRHSSSAINYYLRGNGYSKVSGERLDWKAGDLILSAPGWAMHSHHSGTETTSALTVQDHPLQIAMESLIWQERMQEPILALGSQSGFESNRAQLAAASERRRADTDMNPGSDMTPDRAFRRPALRARLRDFYEDYAHCRTRTGWSNGPTSSPRTAITACSRARTTTPACRWG